MEPSVAQVREIVAMGDQPELRNLLITLTYHELTRSMAELYDDGLDLCWPVFATWASKQAGVFIRKELVPERLRPALHDPSRVAGKLRELIEELPRRDAGVLATADLIGEGVAHFIIVGNTVVFAELGEACAAFVEHFADPASRTQAELDVFSARFRPGPSEPDEVRVTPEGIIERHPVGGQTMLREAFSSFFAALHETDPRARAQQILLANAKCGLHEQTRLQPYIAEALDTPTDVLLQLARPGAPSTPPAHSDSIAAVVRRLATEVLMTVRLPGQLLYLGTDLPAPPGRPLWPAPLERLDDPELVTLTVELGVYETREAGLGLADRAEAWLQSLLGHFGLGRPEAQGSAAEDWSRLSDRMRFIFEMFRSRQQDPRLLTSPFSVAQRAAMLDGRLPPGPL